MKFFSRMTMAALPALLGCACGATVMSRDVEHEEGGDPTGIERLERESANEELDEHEPMPEEPEEGMAFKEDEPEEGKKTGQAEPEKHAISEKNQSVWASGSAENVFDRARRQLRRRCDSGSQAACKALPDVDHCSTHRKRACAKLGDLYARGAQGVDRNPEHARDFWLKTCEMSPADCVRYGRTLFDMEGLEDREAVAEHLFEVGCTQEFGLCAEVGRFYEQKKQDALAKKYFDLGCAAGKAESCRNKDKTSGTTP